MKFKNVLSIILSFAIVFTTAIGYASPALAKSSRTAEVIEVVGEVLVTKAGGSKSYRAFDGMTLNQGDHIETGSGAKLVLIVKDQEDEITIDQNASLYISALTDDSGDKKSKVKIWSGSLWSKVKTLAGTEDKFEVETPTAVMGVRGTTLLVGVDPVTGESKFFIASGAGEVKKQSNSGSNSGLMLLPSQTINLFNGTNLDLDDDSVNVIDLDTFLETAGPGIIEAIIKNKAAMDRENEQFIEEQRRLLEASGSNEQGSNIQSLADLERIQANLDNLVGNIVKSAIEQNKITDEKVKQLIEEANKSLDKKIDLANVKPLELTAQEKQKQEQLKLLEQERKRKLDAEKLKQEELKKQNEALLKKLQEQLSKQLEEKKKAEEAAKKKAEEAMKQKMDQAAQAAFEAKLKALEAKKQEQDKKAMENNAPTPGAPTSDNTNTPSLKKVYFTAENIELSTDGYGPAVVNFDIITEVENVGAVYGAEVHIVTDNGISARQYLNSSEYDSFEENAADYFDNHYSILSPNNRLFDQQKSEYIYKSLELEREEGDDISPPSFDTFFAVTYVPSENPSPINVGSVKKTLVSIPFSWYPYFTENYQEISNITVRISKIILVTADGQRITLQNYNDTVTIPVDSYEFEYLD